jgi:hypothetical protein
MSALPATYGDIVNKLKGEYSSGVQYATDALSWNAKGSILNGGFIGSSIVVFLSSDEAIIHEAPGCVAAPLVNMVALNAIMLGASGQGDQPVPVRLYAPEQLSITTNHLTVGAANLLIEPKFGYISCRKLTLIQFTEEAPPYFEILASYLMNDDVTIERKRVL